MSRSIAAAGSSPHWAWPLVLVATLLVLLVTSSMLPMAWDEGDAIERARGVANWFGRFAATGDPTAPSPWSAAVIAEDWRYTTAVEGHPPLYGIVIAGGTAAGKSWLPPLAAARLGPILLFSAAAAAVFCRLWHQFSPAAAWVAWLAMLALPRLFAHVHFASHDGPLVSAWLLAWAAFPSAVTGWRGALLWGMALGLAVSAKFTGWLAPLPFVAWLLVYRRGDALPTLAVALPIAVVVFFALNPPLWHDSLSGLARFCELNLTRAARPEHNISTQFLGRMYNLDHPLPWYNTLVWTAVAVPLPTLLLAAVGIGAACVSARTRPVGMLVVANWALLVIVRATPWAPPHDGVRLWLPSFAFLAIAAGIGADCARQSAWASASARRRRAVVAVVASLLAGAASSVLWYRPQWLSHYSLVIGGLPGAAAAGMEPTYYWDALDREVLAWLHDHTADDEKIAFAAAPAANLRLLRRWGLLQRAYLADERGAYRWYVVQCRPSARSAADRRLHAAAVPAFVKTIRPPDAGWGPWRLDVPVLEVYRYADYERARAGALRYPTPTDPKRSTRNGARSISGVSPRINWPITTAVPVDVCRPLR